MTIYGETLHIETPGGVVAVAKGNPQYDHFWKLYFSTEKKAATSQIFRCEDKGCPRFGKPLMNGVCVQEQEKDVEKLLDDEEARRAFVIDEMTKDGGV